MDTAAETIRQQRGTKRTCRACETRFYDLHRDPTVCPACGQQVAQADLVRVAQPMTGSYPFGSSSWRSRRKPELVVTPVENSDDVVSAADPIVEAEGDEVAEATPAAGDDTILETEDLDGDVGDLLTPDGEAQPED